MDKAIQFRSEAQAALGASRNDAAMLNAVHVAISAADAVAVALEGRRSADIDHRRAVEILVEVGAGSSEIVSRARQSEMLLAKKQVVEYGSHMATGKEASRAVTRADRLVAWAQGVSDAARLQVSQGQAVSGFNASFAHTTSTITHTTTVITPKGTKNRNSPNSFAPSRPFHGTRIPAKNHPTL